MTHVSTVVKQPWQMGIQGKLILFSLVIALIPLAVVGILVFSQAQENLYQQVGANVEELAAGTGAFVQNFLGFRLSDIQTFARSPILISPNSSADDKAAFLRSLQEAYNIYDSIYVTDSGGRIIASTDRTAGDQSQQQWFQSAKAGEIYISDMYYLPSAQDIVVTVSAPVVSPQGELVGIIAGHINGQYIFDIAATTHIGIDGQVFLVNREGRIVAHANPANIFTDVSHLSSIQSGLRGETGTRIDLNPLTNEDALVGYVPVSGVQPWIAVGVLPLSELNAPVIALARNIMLVALVAAVLIVFAVLVVTRQIVYPIRQLTLSAQQLSAGNFSSEITVQSGDEIGILAQSFRLMAAQLREFITDLEARVADRTRDFQVASDVSRQITQVLDLNRLLPELAELTKSSFNLYHVSVFLFDADREILHLEAATGAAGRRMLLDDKHFETEDRGLVPLAARSQTSVILDDVRSHRDYFANPLLPDTLSEAALPMIVGSQLLGVLDLQATEANRFSQRDIQVFTTLAAQIAVAVRNAQLFADAQTARTEAEKANQVKSMFLASMSHELRTPLNSVINFTKFVLRGYMGPLNQRQSESLTNVVDSAEHLLGLINDVLDMSKIESNSLTLFIEDDVELDEIIHSVVQTAEGMLTGKSVQFRLDRLNDLPTVTGDRQRILQILLNLVSNACKFTQQGEVVLQIQQQSDNVLFSIADTGPGIAAEDLPLIFEAFKQTETGLRQGGGTGLGMPISKKLAEAHGGKLWLESTPGQGTTFYVLLPLYAQSLPRTIALV